MFRTATKSRFRALLAAPFVLLRIGLTMLPRALLAVVAVWAAYLSVVFPIVWSVELGTWFPLLLWIPLYIVWAWILASWYSEG